MSLNVYCFVQVRFTVIAALQLLTSAQVSLSVFISSLSRRHRWCLSAAMLAQSREAGSSLGRVASLLQSPDQSRAGSLAEDGSRVSTECHPPVSHTYPGLPSGVTLSHYEEHVIKHVSIDCVAIKYMCIHNLIIAIRLHFIFILHNHECI